MKRGRYCLRLVSRLCIAFVLVFSIVLGTCVNNVYAGTTLIGNYTYTDSSFDLVGHLSRSSVWDFDTTVYENSYFPNVSENYSVETSRKTFVDSDGNALSLSNQYEYRINFSTVGNLEMSVLYKDGGATCNARLYMVYGGQKYYFTGPTLMVTIKGANSAYYVIGVEFDVSVPPYSYNTTIGYVENQIIPSYKFSKITQQIHQYDGNSLMTPGEKEINSSVEDGNKLQEQNNKLQTEQNKTTNNIFSSISDFFGSFFDNLIGIFVPEDGYFEEFFERLNEFFSNKLGMLYAPIDIFIEVLTAISEGGGSAGIIFPQVKWQEYVLIEEQTINLQSIADELGDLQEYIYLGTDVIMVGSVINLLQNKLREVLKT